MVSTATEEQETTMEFYIKDGKFMQELWGTGEVVELNEAEWLDRKHKWENPIKGGSISNLFNQ